MNPRGSTKCGNEAMNTVEGMGMEGSGNRPSVVVSAPMEFVEIPAEMHQKIDITFQAVDSERMARESKALKSADAWVVSPCPTFKIDGSVVSEMPNLKIVITPSTGVNHINLLELRECNIEVRCLLDDTAYLDITASSEFSFLLILSTVRNLALALEAPLNGDWRNVEATLRGRELSCLRLGLYGLGRIGTNVARYAEAFGMEVSYYDPYKKARKFQSLSSLQDLFESNDVVLICPYLNEETSNSITESLFSEATRDLILINSSRGEVVCEDAIVSAINSNYLARYSSDVLQGEVTGDWKTSPLLALARTSHRVSLTPHIAGLTRDSESKAQLSALRMAADFFAGAK